jgi:hypothetical protein
MVPIIAGAILIALVIAAPHGWQDSDGYHDGEPPA